MMHQPIPYFLCCYNNTRKYIKKQPKNVYSPNLDLELYKILLGQWVECAKDFVCRLGAKVTSPWG
jgi:hypothetical protein